MLGLFLLLGALSPAGAEFQVLRVLWTSDLHGQMLPTADFAAAGLPRRRLGGWEGLARLIKGERTPATLLVDLGDFGFGSPEGDSAQGRLAVALFNRLGYDAAVLGARDFTGGIYNLEVLARFAAFPILAEPMLDLLLKRPVPLFRPYRVIDLQGVKVGLIGVTDPDATVFNRRADVYGLVLDPPVRQVARWLPAVRAESAEVVVVLGHIAPGAGAVIVESVPGVDLVLCRGEVTGVESQFPGRGSGAVLVAGVYGQRLGVADILFHRTERRVYAVEARVLNVLPGEQPDSVWRVHIQVRMDSVVAVVPEEFCPDEPGRVRLGMAVAQAVRAATGADIAVIPLWAIENGVERGPATRRELFNVAPYGERLRVLVLPESLLSRMVAGVALPPELPAPAVAGADLFVTGDTVNWPRLAHLVGLRLRDRRKGFYRVVTTENWLENTGISERGKVFPENLTAVWLKTVEQLGSLTPVAPLRLFPAAPESRAPVKPGAGLIDINSAPVELLCELPGIGPKTAQRIVEYRARSGKFKSIEEIMNVRGIGPKKFQQIKGLITVR